MDAQIDPIAIFGLQSGEAHVIRNAGGLAISDVLRSLVISQRALRGFVYDVDSGHGREVT